MSTKLDNATYAKNHLRRQSKSNPCLHWLLRQCKFKKKDFSAIYKHFGYINIAAYLRWVANEQSYHRNINDMEFLKADRKIFEYSIRWKNIEWTFDCSKNDFEGHNGTRTNYPHYHFQMRVDDRPFINFGDFHVPFNEEDLFKLSLAQEYPKQFHFSFNGPGAGMQEAVEIDVRDIIEESTVVENSEEDGTYDMSTIIVQEGGVDLQKLLAAYEESKAKGKTVASLAKKYFDNANSIETIVSPADTISPIANSQ